VDNEEEGPGHCAECKEALGEVRDTLLDDVVGDAAGVALVLFVIVGDGAGYAKGLGVEWCLWDEAVGEGNSQETGDASGETK
jgi:hypothetical protein